MEMVGNSQSIPMTESGCTRDVISNLPQVLVERILLQLPIKEAVRTSILARAWKSKWTTLPELVFDEQSIGLGDGVLGNNDFMNIIGNVLSHHEGCIQKITISCSNSDRADTYAQNEGCIYKITISCSNSNRADSYDWWIPHVQKKRIQENVASRLFACQYLCSLTLKRCNIKLPCSFVGCKCLKTLYLDDVQFDNNDFVRLTSGCPVLENLTLVNVQNYFVKICAPTVKYLYIEGKFTGISFENAACISYLHICLNERNMDVFRSVRYKLVEVISCLPSIEKLELRGGFTKFLSMRPVPTRFPTNFNHLKEMYLTINFKDVAELSTVLCLCRSSPSLKYLEITALLIYIGPRSSSCCFWMEQDRVCDVLNQLQTLRIIGFSAYINEMVFIQYLVRKSPTLEKITLVPTEEAFSKVAAMYESVQRPKASVDAASGTVELVF